MKLPYNIEVNNRLLSSVNPPDRRKVLPGCLSIVRRSVNNKDLWLLLQTSANKQGKKYKQRTVRWYKIEQNIDQVITKFVQEGKATNRMREPLHDLIIQCDAIQLKSFLHVLKLGCSKKINSSVRNTNPKNITVQNTKVVVTNKSDYLALEGFPQTTQAFYCISTQ